MIRYPVGTTRHAEMLEFHSDQPVLPDELDHAPHVVRLAQLIQTCDPPFVMGVHGDWATGKASFLQKLLLFLAGKESGYTDADKIGIVSPRIRNTRNIACGTQTTQ